MHKLKAVPELPAVVERPVKSLPYLLSLAQVADDATRDYQVDLLQLGKDLRSCVDETVQYLDYLDAREAAIRKRVRMMEENARSYATEAKAIRKVAAEQMHADATAEGYTGKEKANSRYRIPGRNFRLRIKYTPSVKPKNPAPTARQYLDFQDLGVINCEFTWNLDALRKLLNSGDETAKQLADFVYKPGIETLPNV